MRTSVDFKIPVTNRCTNSWPTLVWLTSLAISGIGCGSNTGRHGGSSYRVICCVCTLITYLGRNAASLRPWESGTHRTSPETILPPVIVLSGGPPGPMANTFRVFSIPPADTNDGTTLEYQLHIPGFEGTGITTTTPHSHTQDPMDVPRIYPPDIRLCLTTLPPQSQPEPGSIRNLCAM